MWMTRRPSITRLRNHGHGCADGNLGLFRMPGSASNPSDVAAAVQISVMYPVRRRSKVETDMPSRSRTRSTPSPRQAHSFPLR